jgi:hypothetical protein
MSQFKIYDRNIIAIFIVALFFHSCEQKSTSKSTLLERVKYIDTPFFQEYHDAFIISDRSVDNDIRSIAVDKSSNVWIATASGIFYKEKDSREWKPIITGKDRGPAYSVVVVPDGAVLMGTWNGIYRFHNNQLKNEEGVKPPISVICGEGKYALGPHGIWLSKNDTWEYLDYKIARSVRDAIADDNGALWVATDVGLYHCKDGEAKLYQNTDELISCYVRGISFAPDEKIWAGVMGGVSIRQNNKQVQQLTPKEGIPSAFVNCVNQSPDGVMWVGTDIGVVRYAKDGSHSLRFSKRWLTNNKVNDIAFDKNGNAWIATANGVSAIKRNLMTLKDKEENFYSQLMRKHIRKPWICGVLRLEVPGDTASWRNSDDDNDGEYTGGYLAMESFRYAVTKDEDARIKARKAFDFLRLLQEVTETEGFFARTIVPIDWTQVHDANRTYTERQLADELVKDPRYKPVEQRWRKSKDGKWLWKGDTSSDEMDGHLMGYFYFYELAADNEEKQLIRDHVKKIMDELIKNNYNLIDIDGTHTRWSVWSPEQLNGDPDWASEKSLNSFELLAFLKFVGHITGDEKYEKEYRRLIDEEGYLENVAHLNNKNPAWQIYFDRTLEGYIFPILLRYEKDPQLKKFYKNLIDEWMCKQTSGENLINNLTYAFATGDVVNVSQTIDFLKDTPLDLVDWPIDHTLREDVQVVRSPILEDIQISELPPASERATVRWDKNPWAATQGNLQQVREPVFWLWPYWMARYFEIIPNDKTEFDNKTLSTILDTICYSKDYDGHLQGMTTDYENSLFWSHTTQLVKTDLQGNVLNIVDVPTHHGDLQFYKEKIYVAVNFGKFNEEPGLADSWIYVYKSENLSFIERFPVPEVVHGAGGISIHNNQVMVVGGLPGNGNYDKNFVYEYDLNFNFKKRYELDSGYTYKGIQTASYFNDYWYFACYGNKEKGFQPRVLKVKQNGENELEFIESFDIDLSYGMIGLGGEEFLSSNRNLDGWAGKFTLAVKNE